MLVGWRLSFPRALLIQSSYSASASVPLGGPGGTAAPRFYDLDSAPASGIPRCSGAVVDFSAARNGGPRSSGGAETARVCYCGGHGHALQPCPSSSKPLAALRHSYSTSSLRFEGGNAVYDRGERPTTHPKPGTSPSQDTSSPSDVPYCNVNAKCDVVVDVPHHRCSR